MYTSVATSSAVPVGGNDRRVGSRWWLTTLTTVWVLVAGTALLAGLPYYLTPESQRAFAPGYSLYSPTGQAGHAFGVVGSLMMIVGVGLYALRKRWAPLQRVGRLKAWLQFHIFLCTLGPFLILLHTSFKIGGIVSIAFWSMTLVVASGVFGRYVYVRIPKSVSGQFQSLQTVRARAEELARQVSAAAGIPEAELRSLVVREGPVGATRSAPAALLLAVRHDFQRRRALHRLSQRLTRRGVDGAHREALLQVADERIRLEQQLQLLEPFQRMFRLWHVFHLPLAMVMFLILAVHVAVAAYFGYGGLF